MSDFLGFDYLPFQKGKKINKTSKKESCTHVLVMVVVVIMIMAVVP